MYMTSLWWKSIPQTIGVSRRAAIKQGLIALVAPRLRAMQTSPPGADTPSAAERAAMGKLAQQFMEKFSVPGRRSRSRDKDG